ncbi:MAG: cell division protein FtsH [Parcubacteria group bacterium RIFCSPHIGHO2_01_FULL_47_10b]|nr:MAG: cell division protein FtsH [Parcubacteria group bacterium RIFCSPHIGHO2_01_FULL_47_10b]
MSNLIRNFLLALLSIVIIAGLFTVVNDPTHTRPTDKINFSTFAQELRDKQVKSLVVRDEIIEVTKTDNTVVVTNKERGASVFELLNTYGLEPSVLEGIEVTFESESTNSLLLGTLISTLLPLLIIGGFIWYMMRQAQRGQMSAMRFGKSNARVADFRGKKKATFADVAGLKESKEELKEIVDFLKNPKKYLDMGAKIPRGVLLIGNPGTGKTTLARAVAGEANVPFFHASGSEFVELFVGVGASRVRDLFQTAKKHAPALIFIDEIDAVGRMRGTGLGGGHDEREQTLNQILSEMDGFERDTGLIVLAATNRPDVLDPALLRPGRFDRTVMLDMPDINERFEILKIHATNKPLSKDVKLRELAERTVGFSGADLENLLNEAAIRAAVDNKKTIHDGDLYEALEKVLLGSEKKSRIYSAKEKRIAAYHEAGHALVAHILPNTDPIRKVSIVARGSAGGFTLKLPEEERHYHTRSQFLDELATLLGGYAAELLVFSEVTTGASSDLKRAADLARSIVTRYGMSDKIGPVAYDEAHEKVFLGRELTERRIYSEHTAALIDSEVSSAIKKALKTAQDILKKKRRLLEKVASELIKKENLERADFEKLVGMPTPQPAGA